ncbi:MAG TPA: hypothetical protein EYO58_09605 [Flavobacteriales bacterium]|nr:hypothetical protein [Flavobacteriales bacterium]
MLRLKLPSSLLCLYSVFLSSIPSTITAQTLVSSEQYNLARARQAYHSQRLITPQYAPSITNLLDSLHWRNEFSAFCPTDGGPAVAIRNKGKSSSLTPPTTPNHPWEPIGWSQSPQDGTWKATCPGDSVFFTFNQTYSRASCSPEPDTPPWGAANSGAPNIWWIEAISELGISTGSVYTRLGQDQNFDKPVIIVEGFDFGVGGNTEEHRHGSFGWQSLFGCNLDAFPGTSHYPILLDSLYNLGYDLVFVDFADGAQTIEIKSELVMRVIELCNSYKTSNNSLILIGASMGGIVSRHALCTIEQENNDHCTRLFISIDSPHRGANISAGLIGLVSVLSIPSSEAAIFYEGLYSPAAKQLLINLPIESAVHTDAMAMLMDLGMPQRTMNIGIANSHAEVSLELENAPLLSWTESWWWLGTAHLLANRHPNGSNSLALSASCSLPVDFIPFNGIPLWYDNEAYSYYPENDLDVDPASIGRHMEQFVDGINASGMLEISIGDYQPISGFIPTSSAINCNILENEDQTFDYISMAPVWASPEEHVALTQLHRKLVLDHIILGDEGAPSELGIANSQSIYEYHNFDNVDNWLGSTQINEGGSLRIGGVGIAVDSTTVVRTKQCNTVVEVNSGGEILVGSLYDLGMGTLIITGDNELYMNPGSELNIFSGSKLVVESGANIILDNLDLQIHSEGTLEVQTGGNIYLRNNARIILNGIDAELVLKGGIHIEEDSHSSITSSSEALFEISITGPSASINIENGAELLIQGCNNINFNEGAQCFFHGDGTLKIIDTDIHMSNNSIALQACKAHIKDIIIYGASSSTWKSSHRLRIDDSNWSRVSLHIDSFEENNGVAGLISIHNQIEECNWTLENTGFKLLDNEFRSTIFQSINPSGPSQLTNNTIEGAYGFPDASIEILGGDHVSFIENLFLEGVVGLSFINAQATLSCNQFEGWDTAIKFKEKCDVFMNPQNGGGYNRLNGNRVHLEFDNSNVPLLNQGGNSFGTSGTYCLSGNIDWNCNPTWLIEGNYWLEASATSGVGGGGNTGFWQIATDLSSSNSICFGEGIIVQIDIPDSGISVCPSGQPTDDDGKKNLDFNAIFDLSGRVINDATTPSLFFKINDENKIEKTPYNY